MNNQSIAQTYDANIHLLNEIPADHRLADADEAGWYFTLSDDSKVWITDSEPRICDECGSVGTPGALLIDPSDEDGARAWYCQECQNDWQAVAAFEASLSNDDSPDYLAFVSEPPCADPTDGRAPSLDLPAAPVTIEDQTSDTFSSLETSTAAGREVAAPDLTPDEIAAIERSRARHASQVAARMATPACPDCGDPSEGRCRACREDAAPANPRATLMALLKAALEEWKACGLSTPYDAELMALARAMAMDGQRTLDQICGEALAYAYCKEPGPFLEKFDSFGAPRQAAITHAVAAWMGKPVSEVDRLWVESREMLQNAAPA